jgi:hypothetical protein
VKDAIDGQGVSVFDRGQDVLPGQEEAQLVAFALSCKAFVVIMSPAYRSDMLACRLDLHLVHQALSSGRVAPENVQFIHTTSNLLPPRHGNSHSCGNMAEAASTSGITHSSGHQQERPNVQLPEQRAEDAARCGDVATACHPLLTELNTCNESQVCDRDLTPGVLQSESRLAFLEADCPRLDWSTNLSVQDHLRHVARWARMRHRDDRRQRRQNAREKLQEYLQARVSHIMGRTRVDNELFMPRCV